MKLCVNHLVFNPIEKSYMCYISKLPEGFDPFTRLFPEDTGDDTEGFQLKAHTDPSMYVDFMLADTEHSEGDVSAWIFVAVPDSRTMRMGMLDTKIKIINF